MRYNRVLYICVSILFFTHLRAQDVKCIKLGTESANSNNTYYKCVVINPYADSVIFLGMASSIKFDSLNLLEITNELEYLIVHTTMLKNDPITHTKRYVLLPGDSVSFNFLIESKYSQSNKKIQFFPNRVAYNDDLKKYLEAKISCRKERYYRRTLGKKGLEMLLVDIP